MATASKILKNFALFVDGRGYAGNIDELQLPTLAVTIEDFRAGGMDSSVPVEMGQDKMESTFTLSSYDSAVLGLWGIGQGSSVPLVARGALESLDGSVESVTVTMDGKVRSIEPGAWTPGAKSSLVFTVDLTAYKYVQNGTTVHEIDVPNMVRKVNGVDRLASQRNAIGI